MKTKETHSPGVAKFPEPADPDYRRRKPLARRSAERGVALIIVLALIALATVLVVAFMASVQSSKIGENAAASETSAAQLAASAVQLVEGTITHATEPTTDTTFAWACQPGMIRTYGTGSSASADPLAYYKLYSSDNMVVSGMGDCNKFTNSAVTTPNPAGPTTLYTEVPQYWDMAPALYADLNAPLLPSAGTPIFPILDPRAADLGVEGFVSPKDNSTLDGVIPVKGAATTGTAADPIKFSQDSGARLPMPVRWMYVLRDGTMTVPDGPGTPSSTKTLTATWSAKNVQPTPTNPIVGRVAFWTDDEDAKVNVNIASEGTYWDTPVANSDPASDAFTYPQTAGIGEVLLAGHQGVQYEYQRYPGHPATTCLSSVFGNALSSGSGRAAVIKSITAAIPRITDDLTASSMGGTNAFPSLSATSTPPPLVTDLDRLYSSLDEFQFTTGFSGGVRTPQTLNASGGQLTAEQNIVDTCRFFMTAHSKAPELNLFGLPRVAIWPLWDDTHKSQRTPFENEILRCATLANGSNGQGGDPHQMAFFRSDPNSSTNDWTRITRNQQVYGYLQQLASRAVPGFGGNFLTQYGMANRDQILTEIFDYIRSTNLADNSSTAATPYTGTLGMGMSANVTNSPNAVGQVVPIQINNTHGLGRIATISELALVLSKVDDRKDPGKPETATNLATTISYNGTKIDPTKQTLVEWTLIPKLCSPMAGYVALANNIRLKFTSVNLSIGGASTSGPYPDMYDIGRISCEQRDTVIGGNIGCETLVEDAYHGLTGRRPDSMYPTGLIVLPGTSGSPIQVSGTVEVQLLAPNTATQPLQTFEFAFSSAGAAIPALIPQLFYDDAPPTPPSTTPPSYGWYGTFRAASSAYTAGTTASFTYPSNTTRNETRLNPGFRTYIGGTDGGGKFGTDVIRSVSPTGKLNGVAIAGDTRLVALTQGSPSIPTSVYEPTLTSGGKGVTDSSYGTAYAIDALRCGTLVNVPGQAHGSLTTSIPVGNYFGSSPDVPPQPTGTTSVPFPGDWDNGPGLMIDGPWANKPDEGMTADQYTYLPYIGNYESMVQSGAPKATLFSPNRQISSPVMFGSLPAGWLPGGKSSAQPQPWRTLLFRPSTLLSTTKPHPGGGDATIRDHLLLDLFWMPIVEPYGISEPMATSGKINLNYQIAPFTYITRRTGLNAVLKSVMLTALNPTATAHNGNPFARWYKSDSSISNPTTTRYPIDADTTLVQLNPGTSDTVYSFPEFSRSSHTTASPNFFVSASQICDVPLVPQGIATASTPVSTIETAVQSFWTKNSMTGDNSLERPYSLIYPRVTTKSNIFTVHVLAQSLKKIATDPSQNTWNEGKDLVTSEYRGAYTVEKYFDPNTDDITTDAAGTVKSLAAQDNVISPTAAIRNTKWRLLSVKRFGQ